MPETRTFVAVKLSADALEALRRLGERLRRAPGGAACRFSAVEAIHLTLKFLGNVLDTRLPEVYAAADRAAASAAPFRLRLGGVGCFPGPARPRVVWAGVAEGAAPLVRLATALDEALARAGFAREERPFRPHLTIARVRQGASREETAALGRTVAAWPEESFGEVAVERLYVFGSDLRPGGPVHTVLHEAALLGGAPAGQE